MARPRMYDDDLCVKCRKKPRQILKKGDGTYSSPYCKPCNKARHQARRAEFRRPGDLRFHWNWKKYRDRYAGTEAPSA